MLIAFITMFYGVQQNESNKRKNESLQKDSTFQEIYILQGLQSFETSCEITEVAHSYINDVKGIFP